MYVCMCCCGAGFNTVSMCMSKQLEEKSHHKNIAMG